MWFRKCRLIPKLWVFTEPFLMHFRNFFSYFRNHFLGDVLLGFNLEYVEEVILELMKDQVSIADGYCIHHGSKRCH